MDFASPNYFQSSSNEEPPLETSRSSINESSKRNPNPFVEAFPDPICNLNLKETSEFVKVFPVAAVNGGAGFISAQKRKGENTVTLSRRSVDEAPSTPGRSVFRFSSARKSTSSKWDDAEKWLVNNFSHDSPAHPNKPPESSKMNKQMNNNSAKAFNRVSASTGFLLKDKFTDDVHMEPSKEGFIFRNSACNETMKDAGTEVPHMVKHKDIGTEMTPLGSSTTSRCHTPVNTSSPVRHNTPANRSGPLVLENSNSTIDITHLAKLQLGTQCNSLTSNWSSREEEEEEVSKSLRHFETGNIIQRSTSHSRAAAWEEEQKTECCLRYQREEARIQAWVNLQSAKAEAESKKLEVKIQKMRSDLEEKLMKKMAFVHRKAEEWRAEALEQHAGQIQRAGKLAQKMNRPSSKTSSHGLCGCFPCNTSC